MSNPLGIFEIMTCLVSQRAERTLHYMMEVGPSATLEDVAAVAARYAAKSTRKLSMDDEAGMSAYGIERALRGFVMLSVLSEEGGRFAFTQAAVDHYAQAIGCGCTEAEYATAPSWIRAIVEGDEAVPS